jgi:hypothetical protein
MTGFRHAKCPTGHLALASRVDGPASQLAHWQDTNIGVGQMPPPSREQAAADAAQEIAAYALVRAWMADDADTGMLMIKQHHVPPEAALFVMSLVKAASRAILSAEGYQVERALAVLDQWLEDASERAAV